MEEEVERERIASEYASLEKQIRKKERKLKKVNKVLKAKEHVRRTVEVYTRKKSPHKDPKVPDTVKFKEGLPEVRVIPSATDPVNNHNTELSIQCQINLENNSVSSRTRTLQRKVKNSNNLSNEISSTNNLVSNNNQLVSNENKNNFSKQSSNEKNCKKEMNGSENVETIKKGNSPSSSEIILGKNYQDYNSMKQLSENEILPITKKHSNGNGMTISFSSKSGKKLYDGDGKNSLNSHRKNPPEKVKKTFKYLRMNDKSIINHLQSQDLFAPTLVPSSTNLCTAVDTPLTNESSFPVHLNENMKNTGFNRFDNDDELQNDSFTEIDFNTLPQTSELNSNDLYKNGARSENAKFSSIESHELTNFTNDQFFSQNINIVRKRKSRKRTSRNSQDSLVSNGRNKRLMNITYSVPSTSCEELSTNKTIGISSEYTENQSCNGFLNYREPNVNSTLVTNNSGEDLFQKEFNDDSSSLRGFAMVFDEMGIESNTTICNQDEGEDELIILEAEKAELNLEILQNKEEHLDSVNENVHSKNVIKDSKFSLSKNMAFSNNTCNIISEESIKGVIGDKNLKSNVHKEFVRNTEFQSFKFPIPESFGRILICAVNVHNSNPFEVNSDIKRSIPTVLVVQEFGLSLWRYDPKTTNLNQHSKVNFQKSWQEIGRKNYNFGKNSEIMHIVANGLPSVENDVRFYVITKKDAEKDGHIIYIQVATNTQFPNTADVVVTESLIPISSVCKGLYSSVLSEWSIAIYYILQLETEVSSMTDSGSTSNHQFDVNMFSKALHVEFDLSYLMRKRCWKLDHQTTPLFSIGNITSMVPLTHKDMNGLLLLLNNSESKLEVYDVEMDGVLQQISFPGGIANYLQWAAVVKDIIIFMISYKKTVELWAIDSNTGSVEKIFTSNLEISHNITGNCESDSVMVNATYVNKNFFAVSNCGTVWLIPTSTI